MKKRDIVKLVFVVLLTVVAVWAMVLFAQTGSALKQGAEEVDNAGEAIGFTFAAIFIALIGIIGGGVSIVCSLIGILICSFGVRKEIRVKENGVSTIVQRAKWVRIVFWVFLGGNAGMVVANVVLFALLGK